MAEVTAGGIRFHVQRLPAHRQTGSGTQSTESPTVVFVHGLVIDNMSSFYYTLANPAARAGAEVILYDMRGHGGTERPITGYSLEAAVNDLTTLLDTLEVARPVHVVGNSFGATVALALAMTHPERIARLLLIEPAVVTEDWVAKMSDMFAYVTRLLRGEIADWRPEHGRKADRLRAAVDALVNGTTLPEDLRTAQPFPHTRLQSVTCPVMAVYGETSDLIDHAHTLKRLLPNCELTVVPNCSHLLIVEAPSVLRELLLRQLTLDALSNGLSIEKVPV